MRFTYEKTFDISRRLARWANNQYSTKKNKIPDYFDEVLYKRMDIAAKKEYEKHLKDNLGYTYAYNPNSGGKWIKK
jgi:hypothetical protein